MDTDVRRGRVKLAFMFTSRIGRKKSTVIGVVVSFFASLIAVFFQRDLKNTGFMVVNIIMAQGVAKFFYQHAVQFNLCLLERALSDRCQTVSRKVARVLRALLNFLSHSPYTLGMLEWELHLPQLVLDPCRLLMLFG
ncbi:hypothetical protein pdam_00012897, partial [Pocillopora damicornis]